MALTKNFAATFTPAVAGVPYRPYSKICPPPPPSGASGGATVSNGDSGLPTGCRTVYVPPDPNAGYGATGTYVTVCNGVVT